ncbi:MAG: hypothetical protein PVF73_05570 [Bacteroidales bacterium]|jgi:hypothetical protein
MNTKNNSGNTEYKTGYYSSVFLTVITIITFGFAITAVPISGAFCPEGCTDYPYLDTLKQFPKDFLWMYLAVFLVLAYLVFMVSLHFFASDEKKIYSQIALSFAIISTMILVSDYFIQSLVIPASLENGETEGIPLLIQYNSHGVFLALEELGYLLMSLSFLFIAPVFHSANRLQAAIRWIFIMAFIVTFLSFVVVSAKYGIGREDRFEVIIISVDWLVLIINGTLTGILFRRSFNDQKIT